MIATQTYGLLKADTANRSRKPLHIPPDIPLGLLLGRLPKRSRTPLELPASPPIAMESQLYCPHAAGWSMTGGGFGLPCRCSRPNHDQSLEAVPLAVAVSGPLDSM